MSETNLQRIDRYYIALTVILVLMAVLLIFSFKGVFSAFLTAGSFDQESVGGQVRVNQSNLDEAYKWAFNRNPDKLNLSNAGSVDVKPTVTPKK